MSEQSLDDIMSGRGNPAPEEVTTATPETPAAPAADDQGRARDDKGRFAGKASEAAPPAPAAETQPAAQPNGHVPIQALDAERGKRKELEDQLRDMQQQIARLSQPTPKAPEPAAPPPSMFEDPDAYLQHQLNPVQSQIMEMREFVSENLAITAHGAETVEAAKRAIEQQAQTPEGRRLIQQMMQSRHPFDELVKWHKNQTILSDIGSDPEAYKKRIIEEYLASQQPAPQPANPQSPAPGPLPTSFAAVPAGGPRGGPEYSGPRALSDIMKR